MVLQGRACLALHNKLIICEIMLNSRKCVDNIRRIVYTDKAEFLKAISKKSLLYKIRGDGMDADGSRQNSNDGFYMNAPVYVGACRFCINTLQIKTFTF